MSTATITPSPHLKVSEMAESIVGSEIIKLANEVKEKALSGKKIYNFTIGDFDPEIFPIPTELKNEIIAQYEANETNYPTANGMKELRQAVSRFLHTRGGLEYNENQILIAGGARPIIYAIYQTILDPGDTVLYPVPSWNNNHYSHLSHAKEVFIETKAENNFMPSAHDIKPYIAEANLIALCSPLNPTGTVFDLKSLDEICTLILDENRKRGQKRKPVYLLYDQIYWMLTYGTTSHHDPVSLHPDMKKYTIYVDGISKAFAATGVRVGWSFGPQKIMDKMKAILSHVGAWAPKAEQLACANYLTQDNNIDTYLTQFKNEISARLSDLFEGFKQLKLEGFKVDAIAPQAAIYLTVQLNLQGLTMQNGTKLSNSKMVTEFLLNEANIAIVPFYAFGASKRSSWYRISVGTTKLEEINDFFNNLRTALNTLS